MRDLELVGLSEDRSHVLLGSDSGEGFRVPVDGRLRAAVRGDRVRLGQVEISMDSALRPRDIQARIRAGESPEAVAAVAQVSLDRIMGYAVPVLAEREHVCQQARRSALRRKHASGPGRMLGQAVDEHLRGNGWDPEAATWDAWRREDGRWSVTLSASRGGEPATFLFDVPGRYVFAHDDAARRLVGDEPPLSVEPEPDEPRSGIAAPEVAPDVTRDLTPEVAALDAEAAGQEPVLPAPEPRPRVSALDRLRRQRAQTGDPLPFEADLAARAATEATQATQPAAAATQATAATPPAVGGPGDTDDDVEAIVRAMSGPAQRRPVAVGESPSDDSPTPGGAPRRRKSGRRAVPSWDEIMFGSKPPG